MILDRFHRLWVFVISVSTNSYLQTSPPADVDAAQEYWQLSDTPQRTFGHQNWTHHQKASGTTQQSQRRHHCSLPACPQLEKKPRNPETHASKEREGESEHITSCARHIYVYTTICTDAGKSKRRRGRQVRQWVKYAANQSKESQNKERPTNEGTLTTLYVLCFFIKVNVRSLHSDD